MLLLLLAAAAAAGCWLPRLWVKSNASCKLRSASLAKWRKSKPQLATNERYIIFF
jgi:hypothetical protein